MWFVNGQYLDHEILELISAYSVYSGTLEAKSPD